MELIEGYIFLALIVAVMSVVDLYHPVLRVRVMPMDTRVIHYVIWFIISFLIAPRLVYPCVSALAGAEFRLSLDKSLFG